MMRCAVLAIPLLMLSAQSAAGQCKQARVIGFIDDVSPSVATITLVHRDDPATVERLKVNDVLLHPVCDGDAMAATGSGDIQIFLSSGHLTVIRAGEKRRTMSLPKTAPGESETHFAALSKMIEGFGREGASRSVAPLIWEPGADSLILAGDFHLRWNRPKVPEQFIVNVLRQDGSAVVPAITVSSADGGLNVEQEKAIASILLAERQPAETTQYDVSIQSDLQGTQTAVFSVASDEVEQKARAEADAWNSVRIAEPVRALVRSEVFLEYHLPFTALAECDDLVRLASNQAAILRSVLAIRREVGDVEGAELLSKRLELLEAAKNPR